MNCQENVDSDCLFGDCSQRAVSRPGYLKFSVIKQKFTSAFYRRGRDRSHRCPSHLARFAGSLGERRVAGVSIPAAFLKLLPNWVVILGLVLAIIGELSSLNLVFSWILPLIPLTRFPGFIWLIAAGFALPKAVGRA